jgi:hypothetical protein
MIITRDRRVSGLVRNVAVYYSQDQPPIYWEHIVNLLSTSEIAINSAKTLRVYIYNEYLGAGQSISTVLIQQLCQNIITGSSSTLEGFNLDCSQFSGHILRALTLPPSLSSISIRIRDHPRTPVDMLFSALGVGTLIEANAATLERLELSLVQSNEGPYFYYQLGRTHFPRLKELRLYGPYSYSDLWDGGHTFQQFLLGLASQLRVLILQPDLENEIGYGFRNDSPPQIAHVSPEYWLFVQRHLSAFKNVNHIGIALYGNNVEAALQPIQPILLERRNFITGVDLSVPYFDNDEISNILDVLDHTLRRGCSQLQDFAISVRTLTPDTIDMLATRLVELSKIKINFNCVDGAKRDEVCNLDPSTIVAHSSFAQLSKGNPSLDSIINFLGENLEEESLSAYQLGFIQTMIGREYPTWSFVRVTLNGPGVRWELEPAADSGTPFQKAIARSILCSDWL